MEKEIVPLDILSSGLKFGDRFKTEHGKEILYCGIPFKKFGGKLNGVEYLIFMFEGDYETSFYTKDGYGPYCFSTGASVIFKPVKPDKIIEKI